MAGDAGTARAPEKSEAPAAKEAGAAAAGPDAATAARNVEEERWKPVLGLPCHLVVELPLPGFAVKDFLKLRVGSVIPAHFRVGREVPLQLNGTLIGWIEFEVMGENLAVRLTELA